MNTNTRYMAYNGEGAEQGMYTLDEARAHFDDVEFDTETATITVGDALRPTGSDIDALAEELNRLYPSMVDSTPYGNGEPNASHVTHTDDMNETVTVGYVTAGGNTGEALFTVPFARVASLAAHLRSCQPAEGEDWPESIHTLVATFVG